MTPRVPIIYGAGGIGAPGTFCKLTSAAEAQPVVDAWCIDGPSAIDTSNRYGQGTSHQILAEMWLHGSAVDTKICPFEAGGFSAGKLKAAWAASLAVLNGIKVRVLYLHAPDAATPLAETLQAIDDLHKQGTFELFGLSNYRAYLVAEIVTLCKANGWVVPSVYQGSYSALNRTAELELLPCLRRHNIRFAAYSPLAGGLLVGYLFANDGGQAAAGSRFDPANPLAGVFEGRYGRLRPVARTLNAAAEAYGMTLNEAAVRWLQHHSALGPADHGIIYGGSKPDQVAATVRYNSEGPLPDPLVQAFEKAWEDARGLVEYFAQDPAWYDPKMHGY